ncbi:hypothetical protein M8J76_001127 [Diaphorina citri]|nr:hypothetical protein M8J76_001127 [Diaphorina citri]
MGQEVFGRQRELFREECTGRRGRHFTAQVIWQRRQFICDVPNYDNNIHRAGRTSAGQVGNTVPLLDDELADKRHLNMAKKYIGRIAN